MPGPKSVGRITTRVYFAVGSMTKYLEGQLMFHVYFKDSELAGHR